MKNSNKSFTKFIEAKRNVTNYADFSNIEVFNRPVNSKHVAELKDAMELIGFIGSILAVKTKAFGGVKIYVVDGQHRIEAASQLGIAFNYELIELVDDTKENVTTLISKLNSTSAGWGTKNFMTSWNANNKHEYKVFSDCLDYSTKKDVKMTITDLQNIFLGCNDSKDFKTGKMKFADEKKSMKLFHDVIKMYPNLPKKAFSRRALYKVLRTKGNPQMLINEIFVTDLSHIESEAIFKAKLEDMYESLATKYRKAA